MPSKQSLKNRLAHLEGKNRTSDGVLYFRNGSSRSISIRPQNRFRLWAEAMHLVWVHTPPGPGAPEGPKVKRAIEHEPTIRLLGGAERIETGDRFLQWTWSLCVEALEKERESRETKS